MSLQTSQQGKDWCQVGLKPTPLAVWVSALPSRPLTPPLSLGLLSKSFIGSDLLKDV